jgi:hypothetical protein
MLKNNVFNEIAKEIFFINEAKNNKTTLINRENHQN